MGFPTLKKYILSVLSWYIFCEMANIWFDPIWRNLEGFVWVIGICGVIALKVWGGPTIDAAAVCNRDEDHFDNADDGNNSSH